MEQMEENLDEILGGTRSNDEDIINDNSHFFCRHGSGAWDRFCRYEARPSLLYKVLMLITFLGMEPYMAVGIALSSDVLASAVSAYTYYGKNDNLGYPQRT